MALMVTLSAKSMSYEQAREQALFLTDKMAYELNLTQEQYDAAYEINLDYLMSINSYDDLYGAYWTARNLDLSYILLDWQYRAFCAASYFYRPLYWAAGVWHFAIYSHYPRRDFFYFGRPHIFHTYRGGHGWARNGGQSWYKGHPLNQSGPKNNNPGMRDRFDRGDFGGTNNTGKGNFSGNRSNATGNSSRSNNVGGSSRGTMGSRRNTTTQRTNRESSTRLTAGSSPRGTTGSVGSRGSSSQSRIGSQPKSTFTPKGSSSSSVSRGSSSSSVGRNSGSSRPSISGSSSSSRPSSSVSRGSSSRSGGSFGGGSHSSSHSSGGHSSGGGHSGGSHGGGHR